MLNGCTMIFRFTELSESSQEADNIIELMAQNYYRVPPCIMARMVLKSYLSRSLQGTNAIAAGASKFLTCPGEIEDRCLSRNIARCIEIDDVYSPRMDVYRRYCKQKYFHFCNNVCVCVCFVEI